MGKNPNTFAKRQREMEKKRKAEDKRSKRREKKDQPDTGESGAPMLDQPLDGYADDDETGQATSDATS